MRLDRIQAADGKYVMEDLLVRQLRSRGELSDEEEEVLHWALAGSSDIAADQDIVREGARTTGSTLLVDGFAARYKYVRNGKRQILSIHVPGDFVDLHSFLLRRMDHGVFSLTPCRLVAAPHDRLQHITERYPHLTRLLWLTTLVDAAIHREWLVGMGRRSALANLAHLLCELYLRLKAVDLTEDHRFSLPITQQELADALGLSIVHLNRALQDLRARGLITWQGTEVHIESWDGLAGLGEFDPTYLQLDIRLP